MVVGVVGRKGEQELYNHQAGFIIANISRVVYQCISLRSILYLLLSDNYFITLIS